MIKERIRMQMKSGRGREGEKEREGERDSRREGGRRGGREGGKDTVRGSHILTSSFSNSFQMSSKYMATRSSHSVASEPR